MTVEDFLASLDHVVEDWATSPDAMRWTPEPVEKPVPMAVREPPVPIREGYGVEWHVHQQRGVLDLGTTPSEEPERWFPAPAGRPPVSHFRDRYLHTEEYRYLHDAEYHAEVCQQQEGVLDYVAMLPAQGQQAEIMWERYAELFMTGAWVISMDFGVSEETIRLLVGDHYYHLNHGDR